jgi:hypothetical protein
VNEAPWFRRVTQFALLPYWVVLSLRAFIVAAGFFCLNQLGRILSLTNDGMDD